MRWSVLAALGSLAVTCFHAAASPAAEASAETAKTFTFTAYDKKTIRNKPTTQLAIRVKEWPGQTFLLWLPEAVSDLWVQWDAKVAHQDFAKTPGGGLRWEFAAPSRARVVAELVPRAQSLLLEVRVKNLAAEALTNVGAQNCLHLSEASDFACNDFARIHVRTDGEWRSLAELNPTATLPMYYRAGFLESGRRDSWGGHFRRFNQKVRVDHPLIVCMSKDGRRAIGTASEDYQCLFHNQMPYLRCIHSQQAIVPTLPPGEEAVFRQVIYFVDGGVPDCVRTFQQDHSWIRADDADE